MLSASLDTKITKGQKDAGDAMLHTSKLFWQI